MFNGFLTSSMLKLMISSVAFNFLYRHDEFFWDPSCDVADICFGSLISLSENCIRDALITTGEAMFYLVVGFVSAIIVSRQG